MKAPDFKYAKPETLEEALAILGSDEEVVALAGGQSLMPMMNLRLAAPDILMDLNGLPGIGDIEDRGDYIRVGALTRHAQLEKSETIAAHLPLIAEAIKDVAHPAIRHRGTIGGSLALADPAAELPACAIAANATIICTGSSGERRVSADDFFQGTYETALHPGDLITAIEFPKVTGKSYAFRELARRKGDYAMAGVAVTASADEILTDVRLALFGVSDKPVRAVHAEQALTGMVRADIDAKQADEVGHIGIRDIDIIGDIHASEKTKLHLTKILIKRCVLDLAGGRRNG